MQMVLIKIPYTNLLLLPPSPQLMLPAVPVFVSATGLYDVEYHVSVACRDACVYTFKKGGRTPKYRIPLGSQPCGLQRMDKNVYVSCMDNSLACYSTKVSHEPQSSTKYTLYTHGCDVNFTSLAYNPCFVLRHSQLFNLPKLC